MPGAQAWDATWQSSARNVAPPTPAYGAWQPEPPRRRGLFVTLVVLACIAALALGATLGTLTSNMGVGANTAAEQTVEAPTPQGVIQTVSDLPGRFSHAGTLTDTTTVEFTANVGRAYADSGANGASAEIQAYSPTTERTYDVTCEAQADNTVICTAGRNARIVLWP